MQRTVLKSGKLSFQNANMPKSCWVTDKLIISPGFGKFKVLNSWYLNHFSSKREGSGTVRQSKAWFYLISYRRSPERASK